ncbi:GDYXXLXY domain-containing protein [Sphingoaurantiacus capsulatus]|uniref:GDYXXLXY domain-containing protein n=1 Tax=Sphingoaurantiacus capsulatus TaxID=1771310 RepID=A0ABV7XBG8_9SPHN
MKGAWLAAALALPLVGLAAGVALQETGAKGASEWRIPVAGYDPRDPLRGRYITFRYVWTVSGPAHLCRNAGCDLCLEEGGTHVRAVAKGDSCPARVDPVTSRIALTYAPEFGTDGQPLAAMSRIFVSEASAPRLEKQLQAGPMVMRARLTRDGRLINDALEPGRRE